MYEGHRQWSQRVRLVIGNAKTVPRPGGLGGGEKGGFPRRRRRPAPRGAAAAAKAAPGEGKILPVFQRINALLTALSPCPQLSPIQGFPCRSIAFPDQSPPRPAAAANLHQQVAGAFP